MPGVDDLDSTWSALYNRPTSVLKTYSVTAGAGMQVIGVSPNITIVNIGQSAPITINAGQNTTVSASNPYTIGTNILLTTGTYTPTITSTGNITIAQGNMNQATYQRIGDMVTVSGTIFPASTNPSVTWTFSISLPITTSITATGGTINLSSSGGSYCGAILFSGTVNTATFAGVSPSYVTYTTLTGVNSYIFQYQIK